MGGVHIEGMGWLGVIAGLTCEDLGIDFTWHDVDSPIKAWPISTGCVYPDREHEAAVDLDIWRGWNAERRFGPFTEESEWWFNHKRPPHGAKFPITADIGTLRRGDETCIRVDVAGIVQTFRGNWSDRRTDGDRPDASTKIVAHGFGPRADRVMWGWAAPVGLVLHPSLGERGRRPTIYTRLNRYQFAYAYPIPGRGEFWAGSAFISQRIDKAKELDAHKHFDSWRKIWDQTTGQDALVAYVADEPKGGFRPMARAGDSGRVERIGRLVTVPPLAHSGIRLAPSVADQLRSTLRSPATVA